jgi:ABC-type transporter Mla subunit MlaD
MEQLETVSSTLEASSKGQRDAIDSLIERSAETLSQVGAQFGERLEGESSKLAGVVDHFASSSADMASLGDAFNAAVMMFSESNNQLVENLNRIEGALEKSSSRSDEQLAYYVSQAREIIDHNLLSHQQIIAALHAKKPEQLSVSEAG